MFEPRTEVKIELTAEEEGQQEKIQKQLNDKFKQQLRKQAIRLEWDAEAGAEQYNVYYGIESGVYPYKIEVPAKSASVRFDEMPTGRTFYFVVTTIVAGVESDPSEEFAFTGGRIVDIGINKDKTKISIAGVPEWKVNLGYISKQGSLRYLKTIENPKKEYNINVPTDQNRKYILIPQR